VKSEERKVKSEETANRRKSMDRACSVMARLVIERATKKAYEELAMWHYRSERLGPYTAIFGARVPGQRHWAGVIVYAMPQIGSSRRAAAMAALSGAGESPLVAAGSIAERIGWLNANVRCISRVIVEPRYRGIGLAVRLVRQTLPLAGVPVVEALAAMGNVNPFFEKAGMTRCGTSASPVAGRLEKALRLVGIRQHMLVDACAVHESIDRLPGALGLFIEAEMRLFLKPFVKRRNMEHSLERTRFALSRLAGRPVYYVWRRRECEGYEKCEE
jgi:GNAT superfamily N-acetyltransferase